MAFLMPGLTKKQNRDAVTKSIRNAAEPKKAHGRPSKYTADLAALICRRLADGETLLSVCRDDAMPSDATVRTWALDDLHGFSSQYAKAREIGYAKMADEILEIANTPKEGVTVKQNDKGLETRKGDMIEHRRLQVDTRKWLLSKALPKVYGDKIDVQHGGTDVLLDALAAAGERARNVRR